MHESEWQTRKQRIDQGLKSTSPAWTIISFKDGLDTSKPSHTFVYLSAIQRMARNLFGAQRSFAQGGGDAEGGDDADALDMARTRSPHSMN